MATRISSPFGTVILTEDPDENTFEQLFGSDKSLEGPARDPRVPAVDVYETADSHIILVDLPGVRKPDIEVKYADGMLSILAEAKGLQRDDGHWVMSERRVGRYVRRIDLGRRVDPDRIEAQYTDGILELTVGKPKGEETEATLVEIS